MDRNLEMQLAEEFPFMRRKSSLKEQENRDGMVSDLYSAFGCEMRNGWYELMRGLCGEITEAYRDAGVPVDITVDQVKEKYGTAPLTFTEPARPAQIRRKTKSMRRSRRSLSVGKNDRLRSAKNVADLPC